jgi:multidrug efflux pump subunit AcrA (membrane-fusion protein)
MNMSFTASTEPASASTEQTSESQEPDLDTQLVLETRNQIRALVDEVRRLAESDIPLGEFYDGLLTRVISALAASGGAVWSLDDKRRLQLAYSANLDSLHGPSAHRHELLLRRVLRDGQPLAAPPRSGFPDDDEAGNPTDQLLLLAPIRVEPEAVGLLEIVQRPGAGPTTQRGYLRFLAQMCELAGHFLRNHRLRLYAEREVLWKRLEQFLSELHKSLDLAATSLALVNEARLVVECDRVSLALPHGAGYRLAAVSGLDNVDRRTEQAAQLSRLVEAVLAPGDALWRGSEQTPLAPQIEQPLQAYIDRSHTKAIGIVPLVVRSTDDGNPSSTARDECLGALIFEQLSDDRWSETIRRRVESVVHYATPAVAHALEHDRIFLRPLWTRIGNWRKRVDASLKVKAAAIGGAFLGLMLMLAIVPANFEVAARGKLQPSQRWEIFAPQSGTVLKIPVRHGQQVQAGDLLVELGNTEIEVQLTELQGRQRVAQEQLDAHQRALLDSGRSGKPRLSAGDESRLGGEVLQLRHSLAGLDKEIELVREKQKSLTVQAEHAGEVVTWQVEQLLLRRPVQTGQALMTVVDPSGPWELELYLPERRLKHVDAVAIDSLQATFMLSTLPGREFTGRVVEIERSAEVRGEDGNTVLVRVAFDAADLPPLRSDTTVSAKLHCGRRSIGFVWFCDLIEAVQTKVLFWL